MDHSKEFLQIVAEAMPLVKEVSVVEAIERQKSGARLIDVREDNEYSAGHASGAEHIGRGVIERDIVAKHPDKAEELILYCGGGYRSALAAANLRKMGYTKRLVDGRRLDGVDGSWRPSRVKMGQWDQGDVRVCVQPSIGNLFFYACC